MKTQTPGNDDALRAALGALVPPSHPVRLGQAERVEFDHERRLRTRNKLTYRLSHWPIRIWTFFLAPGPMVFDLFDRGFDARMALWLGVVLLGTGLAGIAGKLPGVEPAPYIIRFTEDRPNPLYRRICYTFAWSAVISFALLNITGLVWAVAAGEWRLRQIYEGGYLPIAGTIWLLGAFGCLPRVKPSTTNEGHERRYFYGAAWAVCTAQPIVGVAWRLLPPTRTADLVKLLLFLGVLAYMGNLARRGLLPRTRPIVPGELAISD